MKYSIALVLALGMMKLYAASPTTPFSSDQYTVALWHFNEGTGDSVHDASGNGNHGQIIGARWVDGKFGAGLLFSGADSVRVADRPSLHVQAVTIEAWVYSDNFGAAPHGVIVSKEYGDMASYRLQNYDGVGHVSMVTSNNWGNHITTTGTLSNGAWHYVAGVAANGYLKVYIDGVLAASAPRTIAMSYDASPLLIGAVRYVANECFRGIIDEVRISSIDRFSPTGEFTVDQNTMALWHFNEGSGDSVFDVSGNGNHGRIVGAQWTQGRFGSALSFSGIDSVNVIDKPSLHTQAVTIEAWVYSENFGAAPHGVIVSKEYGNMASYRLQNYDGVGHVSVVTNNNWGNHIVTTQSLANSAWHYIAGVAANGYLKVYIDGALSGSAPRTIAMSYDASPLLIGAVRYVANECFRGKIDEVRLSSVELSASAIAAYYAGIPATPVPVLIPCLPNPTYDRRPVLRWHKDPAISAYSLQVAGKADFASPLIVLPTADTMFLPSTDLPLGTMYWRVGNAVAGVWSQPSSITIVEKNDSIPVLIPVTPDPQTNRKPLFKWYRALGAASYYIVIDTIGDFINPSIILPLTDTAYTPLVNLPFGKIFWKVSSSVNLARYSAVDTFTIITQTGIRPESRQDLLSGPMKVVSSGRGVLLSYVVPNRTRAIVKVYSMAGVCVATLCDEESQAGTYMLQWNGTDKNGRVLPKGGYLVRCAVGANSMVRKIMLVR